VETALDDTDSHAVYDITDLQGPQAGNGLHRINRWAFSNMGHRAIALNHNGFWPSVRLIGKISLLFIWLATAKQKGGER